MPGVAGIGVVGLGKTQSPGHQQITNYFESNFWNWFVAPSDATQHKTPLGYTQKQNDPRYIQDFGKWSIIRYEIICRLLIKEAIRRGMSVPKDVDSFLGLSGVSSKEKVGMPYDGPYTGGE